MTFSNASLQILMDETVVLIEGSGKTVCAVVKFLIVERRAHIKVPHAEIMVIVMTAVQFQVLVSLGVVNSVVSITCGEIVLTIGIGFAVEVGMGHLHIAVGFPFTVAVIHVVINTCLPLSQLSTVLQSLRVPAACFSWFVVTIQIVGCSVGGKA